MKSYLNLILLILGIFAGFAPSAHAVRLTGLLTINEGIKDSIEVAPGVFVDVYQGGSYFAMNADDPNSSSAAMLSSGTAGGIQLDSFQNFITDPDEPHPAGHPDAVNGAGSGYSGLVSEGSALSAFKFFGVPTYVGLNPLSYQSGLTKNAPTLNMDGASCVNSLCDISVDLSSWEVYWNGSVFEQGPRPDNTIPEFELAMGTVDVVSGEYTLNWKSQILGGPFDGVNGFWYLEGQFTNVSAVVPVPAAVWLFGSGLIGLISFARRRN